MTQEIDVYRNNAEDMLALAREDGLNPDAVDIMCNCIDKITIAGGRGVNEAASDIVVLVTLIIDESGSMNGVDDVVKQCYRDLVLALSEVSSGNDIQLSTWVFNDNRKLLNSFRPMHKIPTAFSRYLPSGGTKLYDTVLSALTSQVLYSQELWKDTRQTRNIVIVMSDGGDNMSVKDPNGHLTKELALTLSEQGDYILAYIGLGCSVSAQELAATIGFTETLSIDKTQRDIIELFRKIASAVQNVSQSTELVKSEDFFS